MREDVKTSSLALSGIFPWFLPAACLLYVFYPTFLWMLERWSARDSYYGHGFLIPLVTAYWITKKKDQLNLAPGLNAWAIAFLILGVAVQILSSIFRIYFLSGFSFVILLIAAITLVFGMRGLRDIGFPVAFLFLMIPLPLLVISQMTLQMKFWATEISVFLMNEIGIRTVREGSYILTPHSVLLVGDPCSGMRSLFAFLCLGLIFAYESRTSLWKKTVIALLGLPIAVASNVLRLFFLSLVAEIYGTHATGGWVHDLSGILVFVLAFLIFLSLKIKVESPRVHTS